MGNCWVFKRCKWPLVSPSFREDSRYQFDPEKDIRIEPKRTDEMREVSTLTNFYEEHFDIGQRTSIANGNCTQIDDVIRETKQQKEITNNNIKLELKAMTPVTPEEDGDNTLGEKTEISFSPEELGYIGSIAPLHDIIEDDEATASPMHTKSWYGSSESESSMLNLDLDYSDKISIDNEPDVIKNISSSGKFGIEETISVSSLDLEIADDSKLSSSNQRSDLSFEQEVYEELENKFRPVTPKLSVECDTVNSSIESIKETATDTEEKDEGTGVLSVELNPEHMKRYRSSFHTIIVPQYE